MAQDTSRGEPSFSSSSQATYLGRVVVELWNDPVAATANLSGVERDAAGIAVLIEPAGNGPIRSEELLRRVVAGLPLRFSR